MTNSPGVDSVLVEEESTGWREAMMAAHDDGFTYLDLLTVVDRTNLASDILGPWEFIAHLMRPVDGHRRWVHAVRRDPDIESVADVFVAAAWHEREIGEMFGIEFTGDGAPDAHPLLLIGIDRMSTPGVHPMRKTVPLIARITKPWPGVHEPGGTDASARRARSRRALRPPGVPEAWLTDSVVIDPATIDGAERE